MLSTYLEAYASSPLPVPYPPFTVTVSSMAASLICMVTQSVSMPDTPTALHAAVLLADSMLIYARLQNN